MRLKIMSCWLLSSEAESRGQRAKGKGQRAKEVIGHLSLVRIGFQSSFILRSLGVGGGISSNLLIKEQL